MFYVMTGAKKGFMLSLLDFGATLLAGVTAMWLSGVAAPIIYNTFFDKMVASAISAQLPTASDASFAAKEAQAVIESLPELVLKAASSVGIDVNSIVGSIKSMNLSGASVAQALADNIAQPIITAVIKAISFIIILIIAILVFKFIARLINKIFKLPVLKTANKALGTAMGALKGAVAVMLIALSLSVAASLMGTSSKLAFAVESSKIVSLAEKYNPITGLKSDGFKK